VVIAGRANLNRAVQGDIVAVHVLPPSQWTKEGDNVVIDPGNAHHLRFYRFCRRYLTMCDCRG
jgi:exoribonuclease R